MAQRMIRQMVVRERGFYHEPSVVRATHLINRYVEREEAALLLQATLRFHLLVREASKLRHESIDKHREGVGGRGGARSTRESSMRDETDTAQSDQLPPGSAAARPVPLRSRAACGPKTAGCVRCLHSLRSRMGRLASAYPTLRRGTSARWKQLCVRRHSRRPQGLRRTRRRRAPRSASSPRRSEGRPASKRSPSTGSLRRSRRIGPRTGALPVHLSHQPTAMRRTRPRLR